MRHGTWIGPLVAMTVGVAPAIVDARPAAAQDVAVTIIDDLEIPTRSGNVLRGDLYLPVVDGEPGQGLPTIVTYFPYVKDDDRRFEVDAMHRFARDGYAGLLVDIAGTGVSPGEFGFLSIREVADGHDVVEWAAAQSFSNGRVGMWGYSYPGLAAAHVAATRPAHLEAVVPASIFHDAYRDLVFPGGILTSQDGVLLPWIVGQTIARQRPGTDPALGAAAALDSVTSAGGLATLAEAPTHTTYDAYWQERALEDKVADIEVPTLLWGGWSDIYPRGTLLNHRDIGADHVRLVVGPWGHLAGVSGEPYELFMDESLRWFDTFLRAPASPQVAATVAGGARIFDVDWAADPYAGTWPGEFVELDTWPAETDDLTFELCATDGTPDPEAPWPIQGTLESRCDTSGELPVVGVPVDLTGGGSIGHDAFADPNANLLWDDKDQRLSLASTALLTEPLATDVVLTGPMELSLRATTAGSDADWVVRVVDVGPDQVRAIAPGWLRASHRAVDPSRPYLWHRHEGTEPITPGEPYQLTVEIWPTSYRVPAGHRLGVLVRTADTLKVLPGVGSTTSTILTGPATSHLTVPVRQAPAAASSNTTDPAPHPDADPAAPPAPTASTAAAGPLPATGAGAAGSGLAVLALAAALPWSRRSSRGHQRATP